MDSFLIIFLTTLSIISDLKFAVSQVNLSDKRLQKEFYTKTRKLWFKPDKMDSYSKLLLCTDILQKTEKRSFNNKLYVTSEKQMALPQFNMVTLNITKIQTIPIKPITEEAMHCPLNTVKFGYQLIPATEFYIIQSVNEYCVYYLDLLEGTDTNDAIIRAEVCGLLIDIRYDTPELEQELISNRAEMAWPELMGMNLDQRFLLCLDIYEKITMYHLRSDLYSIVFSNTTDSLFEDGVHELIYVSNKSAQSYGNITTLQCSMDKIDFHKFKKYDPIEPYYVAQSINKGCVYKLNIKQDRTSNNNVKKNMYIKAEICGVFGGVRNNILELEKEFLYKWKFLANNNEGALVLSPGTSAYTGLNQIKLCENVYMKIYKTFPGGLFPNQSSRPHTIKKGTLCFRSENGTTVMRVSSITCKFNIQSQGFFLLTDSVNLNCVYMLLPDRNITINYRAIIEYEICGVFPIQHTLAVLARKTLKPIV